MKRPLGIVIPAFLLLVIAAFSAYRWVQLRHYPIGSGTFRNSPDRHYQLDASNLIYEDLWGRRRERYRFSIFDLKSDGKTIRRIDMDPPTGEPVSRLRRDARVEWAEDSSAVRVSFGRTELTIAVAERCWRCSPRRSEL